MIKKIHKIRYSTYIAFGLIIFTGWAYINYTNYTYNERQAQVQIEENVTMIKESVREINIEQNTLRTAQRILIPEGPPEGVVLGGGMTSDTDDRYTLLENRIEELEFEKKELKQEKVNIVQEIKDMFSVFKVNASNPMINLVFLPLLGYFFKKILDFGFVRLEERYQEAQEDEV